jgi:hypothetical protein
MRKNEFMGKSKPTQKRWMPEGVPPSVVSMIIRADSMKSKGPVSSEDYDKRLAELAKKYGKTPSTK